MKISRNLRFAAVLYLALNGLAWAEPISQWDFTARVQRIYLEGTIELPFSVQIGDIITGTISVDYADPGAPYIDPAGRIYTNQPINIISASLEGVPLAEAPSSFRHSIEIWNDSEIHEGRDLLFMTYQTLLDPRFPGWEVTMGVVGSDPNGLTVSNLNLPTMLRAGDFGGLAFGYGIIDPVDLLPFYQMEGRLTSLRPAGAIVDADSDGVPDERDQCPGTGLGAIVDAHGCSIEQLAPCSGPPGGGGWKNHGQYVVEVKKVAEAFWTMGLITAEQRDAVEEAAARSSCGKR